MERKQKIRALTALIMKRRQSFKQNIALLMLQIIQNMQIIYTMASEQMNLMLRLQENGGRFNFRKKRVWKLVSKNQSNYCSN